MIFFKKGFHLQIQFLMQSSEVQSFIMFRSKKPSRMHFVY